MQANETLLELWMESLCAELGELSGAPIISSTAPHEIGRKQALETALLVQGPIQGELFVTVESSTLVEYTQLSAGEPLDPEVACNPERIEAWRRLLDSTAARLATRLTENYMEPGARCVLLLADTRSVEDGDPLFGEPGSRIQPWLLQAGQSRLAILARAKIEFPSEILPVARPLSAAEESPAGSQSGLRADTHPDPEPAPSSLPENPASPPGFEPMAAAESPRRRHRSWDKEEPLDSVQPQRLELLLDIELEATLRFGAIEMPLKEVLELGPGDVLSLDRHVQEPVELVVGDRIVARGEVVLVGGNFGLHVTEVAEPHRRLETIRCLF